MTKLSANMRTDDHVTRWGIFTPFWISHHTLWDGRHTAACLIDDLKEEMIKSEVCTCKCVCKCLRLERLKTKIAEKNKSFLCSSSFCRI